MFKLGDQSLRPPQTNLEQSSTESPKQTEKSCSQGFWGHIVGEKISQAGNKIAQKASQCFETIGKGFDAIEKGFTSIKDRIVSKINLNKSNFDSDLIEGTANSVNQTFNQSQNNVKRSIGGEEMKNLLKNASLPPPITKEAQNKQLDQKIDDLISKCKKKISQTGRNRDAQFLNGQCNFLEKIKDKPMSEFTEKESLFRNCEKSVSSYLEKNPSEEVESLYKEANIQCETLLNKLSRRSRENMKDKQVRKFYDYLHAELNAHFSMSEQKITDEEKQQFSTKALEIIKDIELRIAQKES